MAWPPNPHQQTPNHTAQPTISNDAALKVLENTLQASIKEQRSARRWGIFFKILTFVYVMAVLALLGKGCSDTPTQQMGISEPHIAIVDVTGAISAGSTTTNAQIISESLTQAYENEQAKAVVLNINSPGGSPVQSDEIWQTAMDLRKQYPDKKLYATIGDVGASGAYYIAAAADEIWVNPSSLVGSIGVVMSGYNVEKLLDKIGVADRTMTAGEYKDILSPSREMTEQEKTHIQNLLNTTHQNFIDAVKQGRGDKLKNPEQNQLFSGLIWTGRQAVELGLADKVGGISQLKKQLDLPTADYTYHDPMNRLFDRFGVQVGKGLGQGVKIGLQEPNELK